ncbi:low temperature requirement protein A [Streptomyces sp. NBC_00019]|uniref:low temperature requirement protein A n=1 Tax=Streptomyces sp. NBC_00019 TaxID=2975623 RepID=UPI0032556A65
MELTSVPARREVTPLELLFDLVYVFAIGQLSHRLLAHPTWTGAAQTLVLYLAVYAAWAYTTWAVTLVPAEDPQTRRMLLAVMFAGLFMNAAIPRAFGDAGWVFGATFLLPNSASATGQRPSSWPTKADWFVLADDPVGRSGWFLTTQPIPRFWTCRSCGSSFAAPGSPASSLPAPPHSRRP